MKTITDLKSAAEYVFGKLWQKNDKCRIYVTGGNNYHYDGSCYYEIQDDGFWESKCYLTQGYNNSNREDYVKKHLATMDQDMNEYLDQTIDQTIDQIINKELVINYGDSNYEYPTNYYNGCGSYILAFDSNNKIIASYNFDSKMQAWEDIGQFSKQVSEKFVAARIIQVDGSGTKFFARSQKDALGLSSSTYTVPKAGGGRHTNIELIF